MKNTSKSFKFAAWLHKQVPPNWYFESIKVDPFQRYWHQKRFKEVVRVLEKVRGRILDVGSADGVFSQLIFTKTEAKKLIGLDVAKSSVDWANRHWRKKGMHFYLGDAQNLKWQSNSFDAVFCLEVLEHVERPFRVLKEFKRILKRNGYGIFLVPTDNFLFRLVWFFWLHFYPRGWVWRETHIQSFRKNYLLKLCRKVGFKIEVDRKFNFGMLHLVKVRKI